GDPGPRRPHHLPADASPPSGRGGVRGRAGARLLAGPDPPGAASRSRRGAALHPAPGPAAHGRGGHAVGVLRLAGARSGRGLPLQRAHGAALGVLAGPAPALHPGHAPVAVAMAPAAGAPARRRPGPALGGGGRVQRGDGGHPPSRLRHRRRAFRAGPLRPARRPGPGGRRRVVAPARPATGPAPPHRAGAPDGLRLRTVLGAVGGGLVADLVPGRAVPGLRGVPPALGDRRARRPAVGGHHHGGLRGRPPAGLHARRVPARGAPGAAIVLARARPDGPDQAL
ncbi:MAG: hypothetical protein AVDCRST_MAG10-494, partial [uncultured Acidimicrobiales bacterium]